MNLIKKLYKKYEELIKYVFFGVLTTVVSIVSYNAANAVLGVERYLISNIISWVLAVTFAYITNKLWVFSSKSWKLSVIGKEIPSFVLARLASLLIEEAGLFLLMEVMHLGEKSLNLQLFTLSGALISKIIMQIVVVIMNYIFSKLVIFKKKTK